MDKFDTTMAAVAFAEENEHATARALAAEKPSKGDGGGAPPSVAWVLMLGVAVAAIYGLLFVWQNEVLQLTAKGGWTFVLPVGIAFLISFVHGAFTSNLWTAFGLTAKK